MFKFNPITGELDLVNSTKELDIITHKMNEFGNTIVYFDPSLNTFYEADDIVVTDNEGNVVFK